MEIKNKKICTTLNIVIQTLTLILLIFALYLIAPKVYDNYMWNKMKKFMFDVFYTNKTLICKTNNSNKDIIVNKQIMWSENWKFHSGRSFFYSIYIIDRKNGKIITNINSCKEKQIKGETK